VAGTARHTARRIETMMTNERLLISDCWPGPRP
jgi:hypothetical protein